MIEKSGKRRQGRMKAAAALVLSAGLILSGCSKGAMNDGKTQRGYSLPEIMIIAMAEKNLYEEVCTDQIWEAPVPDENADFGAYLTAQIRSFMEEMKIMNLLAEEKGVTLTSEERADMAEAAEEYYANLTRKDISYMGVKKEDVQTVYEDYCLANKLVEELTKDVNLEVSDSEAKVITIMQAATDDQGTAQGLYEAVSQENADFQKCAESAGLSVTTRQLGREEESREFEDAAFALAAGQVSGVVADGSTFYVLKCVNDYDEEATTARKAIIFNERKKNAFREIYDDFKKDVNLSYSGDPWKKLDLSEKAHAENADFFGIYKKYTEQ